MDDRDFSRIAQIVHGLAGIVLADAKRPLVHSRLIKRLRALNLPNFASYADFISAEGNDAERQELITAVTTNVTSFFREQHHFDALSSSILPPLVAKARSGARLRIWSAGCSSGEEPYSIAATVLAAFPEASNFDVRILATDIDRTMVEKTRRAVYGREAAQGLTPDQSRRLFEHPLSGQEVRIAENARRLVHCNALNLQDKWPMKGPFQVIFCRNVVIYFNAETQARLWQRFSELLSPGGVLMIGHSERIAGPALSDFVPDGMTTYRRR